MYGAILGDMIGAPFEFDRGHKAKDFELFGEGVEFTDDSVMTVAVAEALLKSKGNSDEEVKSAVVRSMRKWGRRYPDAGYGGRFFGWLRARDPKPYGSYGNGSAMRVSAAGWLYDTIEETRHKARLTAEVTHNHPEGIKGAEATASAIYMSRTGSTKEEIRDYVEREFGYDLSRTCDEIRPSYHHVESCQETVPEAITAFLEGEDFEDVIRTAVSLGGDSDTLTCIAGSIAEALYGIPEDMITECRDRLPGEMLTVVDAFEKELVEASKFHDSFLEGNENIEQAIKNYNVESTPKNLQTVLEAICQRMHEDGHLMIPVSSSKSGEEFVFKMVQTDDGNSWPVAFTTPNEYRKGEPSDILSHFIGELLKAFIKMRSSGIILNPWEESFTLTNEMMEAIIKADEDAESVASKEEIPAESVEDEE